MASRVPIDVSAHAETSRAYGRWHDADDTARSMIAMIFEFTFDPTTPDTYREYLAASDELRALLPEVRGFEGIERFQSCTNPDKYVAIGFFADEEAVAAWRTTPAHRRVQALGRRRFFTDYRLRMADVTRDYTATDRTQAPADSRAAHDRGAPH